MSKTVTTYVAKPATLDLLVAAMRNGVQSWGEDIIGKVSSYVGEDSMATASARSAFNARNTGIASPQVTIEVSDVSLLPVLEKLLGETVYLGRSDEPAGMYASSALQCRAEMR